MDMALYQSEKPLNLKWRRLGFLTVANLSVNQPCYTNNQDLPLFHVIQITISPSWINTNLNIFYKKNNKKTGLSKITLLFQEY
ncbi:unnamed protein product [Paramecium octaurelia]|uniref:Uncharacterized protein n=1 Tax=Paramecium octaurelia TaxID=43137 RepID=A0A8S1UVA2_PAROT|nr:unnamed protein product [Paramecium octaurelia]